MGSYSESPTPLVEPEPDLVVEPMGIAEPATTPSSAPSGFAVPVVGDAADIFPIEPGTPETPESTRATASVAEPASVDSATTDADSNLSDFILDLGTAPAEEDAAPIPSSTESDDTCADCVYDETCPNKDQRLPKDCGSFQWR